MRKFKTLALLFVSVSMIAASCSKEGPEGPAGVAGAQGPAGAAGPAGPGAVYSAWFVTGTGWSDVNGLPYFAWYSFDKAAPSVTQAVIDNGVVLGYMKGEPLLDATEAAQPFQLPYTVGLGLDFIDVYDFVLPAPSTIRFLYKSDDPWDIEDLATVSFRYVVIQGTVGGGKGNADNQLFNGHTRAELKKMSYKEVATLFNIPEEGSNIQ